MAHTIKTTADIAKAVASVKESHSILDVFYELMLAEPSVGFDEHGRIDIVVTLAEAKRRSKRKAHRHSGKKAKQRSGAFALRKTRLPKRRKYK